MPTLTAITPLFRRTRLEEEPGQEEAALGVACVGQAVPSLTPLGSWRGMQGRGSCGLVPLLTYPLPPSQPSPLQPLSPDPLPLVSSALKPKGNRLVPLCTWFSALLIRKITNRREFFNVGLLAVMGVSCSL